MHPVIKSSIYTLLAFASVVALAYINRDRIDHHFQHLQANYHMQVQR